MSLWSDLFGKEVVEETKKYWMYEAMEKAESFRKIGETFNYLGKTFTVTGYMKISPICTPLIGIEADYVDGQGVIRNHWFYSCEIPTLMAQNQEAVK